MTARLLEHITVTTGAVCDSPRSEVGEDIIGRIRKALAESEGKLWDTGWRVELLPVPAEGAHVFDLHHNGKQIVRCWLCANGALTDEIWPSVASAAPAGTRLLRPRTVPWLAVALLPDAVKIALRNPSILLEAGDLERCVAWAFLE